MALLSGGRYQDVGGLPSAARLSVLKLASRPPSAISFRVLKERGVVTVNETKTVKITQKVDALSSLQQKLREANQKYVSTLSDTTLEAYVHLDGYGKLTDQLQEAVFTSLFSEFAKRKGRTVVHLVSSDEDLAAFALKIGADLATGKDQAQFTVDTKQFFKDKPPVHLFTKSDFERKNPKVLYPTARFVTLEDIQIEGNLRQANVFAFRPIVIFMEQAFSIDEFSLSSKSFKEAYDFFKRFPGYQDISSQEVVDSIQGFILRPIPPTLKAIDINLALRIWAMGARIASQAA